MSKIPTKKVIDLIRFLETDVWRIRSSKLSKMRSFWLKQLRIVLLAMRGFDEDKCQLRASALTYYSLLSIVPVVAMAFGIAKGFGFEKLLEKQIFERLPGQEEVVNQIIEFSRSLLANTQGGVVAGIGVIVLFWSVISVLGNIEKSFNDIWGIKKARSIGRKFADYLSIMLICPILLITASSVTVLIASQIKLIIEKIAFLGLFGPLILTMLNILPYAVLWVLFTFVYIFLPNTKVNFKAGILGGIVAGTIYQIVQWAYLTFQIGVSKYNAIYGSFAALPLFLIWLQMSWRILLLGAEISFADQNVDTYEFEPDCLKVSSAFKRLLSLAVVRVCVKNFHEAKKPWKADEISHYFEMPIRLTRQILFELTEAGLLSEVKMNSTQALFYQPARDIDQLSVYSVLETLDHTGISDLPVIETKEISELKLKLEQLHALMRKSPPNLLLKDL